MTASASAYRAGLIQRFWAYQQSQFPDWERYFDRAYAPGGRPPVFRAAEAWRNVIVDPASSPEERDRLLAAVPPGERHKWFRSMSSSQALAQSILGNLAIRGLLPCLAGLQSDEGDALLGRAATPPGSFVMEYKVGYLGEPRPTSLDGCILGDYRVAVECKFMEADVGTCSHPRLRPGASNYASEHCDGTYSRQRRRAARCALTEIGVKYWRYVPELFTWESGIDWRPCPLNKNYQFVRNVLAAGVRPDSSVSLDGGHVLLIYDERSPAFQAEGAGLAAYSETRRALRASRMLRKCSWQRIVRQIRNEGLLPWLTEQLALKYGL